MEQCAGGGGGGVEVCLSGEMVGFTQISIQVQRHVHAMCS